MRPGITSLGPNRWRVEIKGTVYLVEGQFRPDRVTVQVSILEEERIVYSSKVGLDRHGSRRSFAADAIVVEIPKEKIEKDLLEMYIALKAWFEEKENPSPAQW